MLTNGVDMKLDILVKEIQKLSQVELGALVAYLSSDYTKTTASTMHIMQYQFTHCRNDWEKVSLKTTLKV